MWDGKKTVAEKIVYSAFDMVAEKTGRNALDAFQNHGDFKANLLNDSEVTKLLSKEEIEAIFDKNAFLHNIETIYKRFEL